MQMVGKSGIYRAINDSCLQFMCAVGGFVHAVSFFQQLEEFLNWDSGVRRAA